NPGTTVVIGRDPKGKAPAAALEFSPVEDKAADHLASLVRLCLRGRQQILPFFCAPGFALVETLISRGWQPETGDIPTDLLDAALEKARPHWNGTPFLPGEQENRYTTLVFGEADPFKDSERLRRSGIPDTALMVFTPLLENLNDLS
ncbi:MAG: exodeoxyribonuclease V subunit gamma, partial [Desulfobacterales bacterium]|nr:exodeoxyribonuclease V subunit gamma [Desulfobacterales bacterium]